MVHYNSLIFTAETLLSLYVLFLVGVTPEINERHLEQMASSPIEIHRYIVQTFEQLQNVVSSITSSTGACLVPTASPQPVPRKMFCRVPCIHIVVLDFLYQIYYPVRGKTQNTT